MSFYCHTCNKPTTVTVNSDGDRSCNECNEGFVEEIEGSEAAAAAAIPPSSSSSSSSIASTAPPVAGAVAAATSAPSSAPSVPHHATATATGTTGVAPMNNMPPQWFQAFNLQWPSSTPATTSSNTPSISSTQNAAQMGQAPLQPHGQTAAPFPAAMNFMNMFGGMNNMGGMMGMGGMMPFGGIPMNQHGNASNGNGGALPPVPASISQLLSMFGPVVGGTGNPAVGEPNLFNLGLMPGMMGGNGNAGDYAGGNIQDLINRLMMNDPNRYGPPPASRDAVANLPERKLDKSSLDQLRTAECAVCQETFAEDDLAKELPCNHCYHPACIAPWLAEHNTCPVCRYQLPTDDPYYEQRRAADINASRRTGAAPTRAATTNTIPVPPNASTMATPSVSATTSVIGPASATPATTSSSSSSSSAATTTLPTASASATATTSAVAVAPPSMSVPMNNMGGITMSSVSGAAGAAGMPQRRVIIRSVGTNGVTGVAGGVGGANQMNINLNTAMASPSWSTLFGNMMVPPAAVRATPVAVTPSMPAIPTATQSVAPQQTVPSSNGITATPSTSSSSSSPAITSSSTTAPAAPPVRVLNPFDMLFGPIVGPSTQPQAPPPSDADMYD